MPNLELLFNIYKNHYQCKLEKEKLIFETVNLHHSIYVTKNQHNYTFHYQFANRLDTFGRSIPCEDSYKINDQLSKYMQFMKPIRQLSIFELGVQL